MLQKNNHREKKSSCLLHRFTNSAHNSCCCKNHGKRSIKMRGDKSHSWATHVWQRQRKEWEMLRPRSNKRENNSASPIISANYFLESSVGFYRVGSRMTQPGFGDMTNFTAKPWFMWFWSNTSNLLTSQTQNQFSPQFYNSQIIQFAIQIMLYLLSLIIYLHMIMNITYKDFFL